MLLKWRNIIIEVEELVPGKILTISDFFSPKECSEYIALSENIGYSEAPINTIGGAVMRSSIWNNASAMLGDLAKSTFLQDFLKK